MSDFTIDDVQVQHFFSGREYAKQMMLPAGHYAETHEHVYDHLSILACGEVLIEIDGAVSRHVGPTAIVIKAKCKHRIDALTDSVWFCVHATEETNPATVDRVLIKEG